MAGPRRFRRCRFCCPSMRHRCLGGRLTPRSFGLSCRAGSSLSGSISTPGTAHSCNRWLLEVYRFWPDAAGGSFRKQSRLRNCTSIQLTGPHWTPRKLPEAGLAAAMQRICRAARHRLPLILQIRPRLPQQHRTATSGSRGLGPR
jgi:hypothetical protein